VNFKETQVAAKQMAEQSLAFLETLKSWKKDLPLSGDCTSAARAADRMKQAYEAVEALSAWLNSSHREELNKKYPF
jgi:hypothetical protein